MDTTSMSTLKYFIGFIITIILIGAVSFFLMNWPFGAKDEGPGVDTAQVEETARKDAAAINYVREHISELSPVKERLGGTFYVTNVEVKDGTGIVEYEDGHDAYVADFGYEVDAQGNVTIRGFTLRGQGK